jgi:hypothetical protein
MTKFLVMKKDASAFASSEGTFPVVKGVVEMPAGPLAADLLAEGIIKPMPEKAAPVVKEAPEPVVVPEVQPAPVEDAPAPVAPKTSRKRTPQKK